MVIFGVDEMMPELEELFEKARLDRESLDKQENFSVIVCRFPLPAKKPSLTIGSGIDSVWVYNYTGANHVQRKPARSVRA